MTTRKNVRFHFHSPFLLADLCQRPRKTPVPMESYRANITSTPLVCPRFVSVNRFDIRWNFRSRTTSPWSPERGTRELETRRWRFELAPSFQWPVYVRYELADLLRQRSPFLSYEIRTQIGSGTLRDRITLPALCYPEFERPRLPWSRVLIKLY